ncbi:MAG: hypothetical protein WDM89_11075 [Rhizomicrobium sp.]
MIFGKAVLVVTAAMGFAALPLSSASAYPCNPVTGLFGAAATVAGAAVTIGTAPLVILSGNEPRFNDYTCGPHRVYYRPHGEVTYDGPPQGYYDGPPAYDAPPPPAYYGRPHRPRWYLRHGYAPPPPPPPGY